MIFNVSYETYDYFAMKLFDIDFAILALTSLHLLMIVREISIDLYYIFPFNSPNSHGLSTLEDINF